MNKRGFTLVELMAVLILLAVLIGVSVAGIIAARDKSNQSLDKATTNLIITAAKKYVADDPDNIFKEGRNACLRVGKLVDENYLQDPIVPDGNEDKNIDIKNKYIFIELEGTEYTYSIVSQNQCLNNRI